MDNFTDVFIVLMVTGTCMQRVCIDKVMMVIHLNIQLLHSTTGTDSVSEAIFIPWLKER